MASEIRVNRLSNRSGLSTITFANGGVQFSGITTFANGDFRVGTGATILNPSTNEMQFHTGGSNRLTINNSGANLGTGNITAVDATFTGNVSIGKTLTYEDVKNVDSVGVVTARTGVKITGGDFTVGTAITASSVTGNVTNDVGITTFSGSAVWFKGATANKDMYWSHSSGATVYKDNAQILMGDSSDLQISHDGSNSTILNTTGELSVRDDSRVRIRTDQLVINSGDNSESIIYAEKNGAVQLYYDNSVKLATNSSGVTITGTIVADAINLGDSESIRFGASNDLTIQHNGSHSYINNSTGNLNLQTSGNVWIENQGGTKVWIKALADAAVELYHNNSKKFETTSSGIDVTGIVQCDEFKLLDNEHAKFGTGEDLRIFHDGSNSYIKDQGTGQLVLDGNAVILQYSAATKLATTSSGVTVTGDLVVSANIDLADSSGGSNNRIQLGTGDDLQVYHDGSNGYVYNSGSGNLTLVGNGSNKIQIRAKNGENSITCNSDGSVELYYDNVKTFETTGGGAIIRGTEGGDANLFFYADEGDDNADQWRVQAHSDGSFNILNYADAANETSIKINGGTGGVNLYYNNSKKFETTSAGTLTQGDVVITDAVYLSNASTISSRLTLNSENTSSWQGTRDLVAFDLIGNGADHRTGTLSIKIKRNPGDSSPTEMMRLDGVNNRTTLYTAGSERLRIDSSGRLKVGDNTRPASDANEGAGLRVTSSLTRNQYYSPAGQYFGAIGYTDNTNTKAWLAVDSAYAQSSAVSAGIFLSAFHQDAGGSGCGFTIKNLKTGNPLVFSSVTTASSTGNPAVETERLRITSGGDVLLNKGTQNTLMSNTSDGSDNQSVFVGGGGGPSDTRGAYIWAKGNEYTTTGGYLQLNAGNVGTAPITFSTAGSERLRITSTGQLLIGTTSSSDRFHLLKSHNGHTRLVVQNNWGSNATAQLKLISPTDEFQLIKYASGDAALNLSNSANINFSIGGSERLRIDSAGRVQIGHTGSLVGGRVELHRASAETWMTINESSDSGSGPALYINRTRGSNLTSPSPVADGNWLGNVYFGSYDTNSYEIGARIAAASDGQTWANGDCPARLMFYTTPDGSTTPTERMRISADGHIRIGNWTTTPTVTFQATQNGPTRINFYDNNSTEGCYIKVDGQASGAKLHIGRRWDDDGTQVTFDLRKSEGHVRMGLGTSTPEGIFHINNSGNGTSDGFHYITGTSGTGAKLFLGTTDNSDRSKYIQHSSYWTEIGCHNNEGVRFRESDGDIRFYMNGSSGNYNFTGSNVSDRNLKENIETITTSSIDLIKQVIPRTFNWKHDRKNIPHGGFIAQEMQPLFPKLINGVEYDESRTDDGDPNDENAGKCNPTGMGFDYNGYTAYLTKAMQELIAKVETLEAEIAVLKGS